MQIIGFIVRDTKTNKCKEINIKITEETVVKTALMGVTTYTTMKAIPANASTITEGVQPIIEILKDLAEPISYGFMIKGFLKLMSGEEHEGIKIIKCAITGYIGIQWIPMIFRVIKSVKF